MLGLTIDEEMWAMAPGRVSFSDQVKRVARQLAFDAVGIARAGPDVTLDEDVARWEAFTSAGMHGEMAWLARNREARLRLDGEEVLAGARSVVCVARRYPRADHAGDDADGAVRDGIAAYAGGHDYHRFVRRRLRRLATFLRSLGTLEAPVEARPLCDEEPVLERAWAVRAGLGFIGKNGVLLVPGIGSMVLLGEVVTTLELEPDRHAAEPVTERCGACTRCLDACPTSAFVAPRVLDPRRCVSYLTIEHRSAIAPELREGVGRHLFGCDDCQTVCPFNAGTTARAPARTDDGDPFAPLEKWSRLRLEDLLSLDEAAWRAASEGTPLKRAGRAGLARNAAIVLGNTGDARALPALRACAGSHDDPVVREAAAWAVQRIEKQEDQKIRRSGSET
jgi:epoxyqueuosine reductase